MAKINPKGMLRWLVLLSSLALAMFFLNSAFFGAWNAGGPLNAYREAWEHRSIVHLAYAIALLLGGFGLLGIIRRFPHPSFLAIALLFLAGVVALLPHGNAFFAQDACLDAGGKWLQAEYRCEK